MGASRPYQLGVPLDGTEWCVGHRSGGMRRPGNSCVEVAALAHGVGIDDS
ncbi:hypothetical protein [Streptomyces sp. NPDC004726]